MIEREENRALIYFSIAAGLVAIAGGAFTFGSRRKIGERDDWECQEEDCNRSHKAGWMVTAAHYDHDKGQPEYNEPDNGRILCIAHHAIEELARGNVWGAKKLLSMGLYTRDYAQSAGGNVYLTLEDLQANKI